MDFWKIEKSQDGHACVGIPQDYMEFANLHIGDEIHYEIDTRTKGVIIAKGTIGGNKGR
ncbi:MAG: hypothetical protein MUP55_01025 [Candidatus Aenigmarchaeota archaeon]|nr:hypothetical protein [Candidatus Aenigmarchaeota archaeon]